MSVLISLYSLETWRFFIAILTWRSIYKCNDLYTCLLIHGPSLAFVLILTLCLFDYILHEHYFKANIFLLAVRPR